MKRYQCFLVRRRDQSGSPYPERESARAEYAILEQQKSGPSPRGFLFPAPGGDQGHSRSAKLSMNKALCWHGPVIIPSRAAAVTKAARG